MSFKDKIDMFMEASVRKPLVEANLKVSHFTGKIADKKGFTMKKIGSSNPGAAVILQGDEKAIVAYAKKYLGADQDAETISDVKNDVWHPQAGIVLDKDQQDEAKKMDPVGQADADIDNDGDVDDSDEYLHKKRKAIKKAIEKDKEGKDDDGEEVKEGGCSSLNANYLKSAAKAKAKKKVDEHIKGGLEKGSDGYSSHDYHRIAIALAGGQARYDRMSYGDGQRMRDKAKEISDSEKDRILSQPTPR